MILRREEFAMSIATPAAPVGPSPVAAEPLPPLEQGERMDRREFHARYAAMPPGTRAELIGGRVYIMASAVRRRDGKHQIKLWSWLDAYESATPGVEALSDTTAILAEDSEPQPDVAMRVMVGGRTTVDDYDYVVGCPELVCEVASSTASYDLHEKLADYERYGAIEYVAVLVRTPEVRWHRRGADGRLAVVPPDADGLYRSTPFPGLWLDPAALLAGDTRRLLEVLAAGLASAEHAAFAAELIARPAAG
jgi:Uma2 family endonuclease